jgi:hypothetical protein
MRKFLASLLLLLAAHFTTFSQSTSIKGTLIDTNDNGSLKNTVVSIVRQSDSVLVRFTRTDKDGNFVFPNIKPGKYIFMATHPYFGDFMDKIEISSEGLDLGKIVMTPKSKLLAEVIVKSGAPIRIKGDTTVYTADSFKVREGANVEELLRRLPGIQVGKNGEIIAMGEKVKKVLVDGEEFFGDDPGIATKNLRADIVKEVEVFDKKSDQATFTGIDDGVKDKTINLKLKDNKKRGYFGKVEAGGGLKDKFNNDIMLNAFQGKRKIAAYGIMSNTGQTNLDWRDAQNYGDGSGMESGMTDDGGMFIMFGGGDDSYWGGRNGIPTNWNSGFHFSDKYNADKKSINLGYKFSKVNAPAGSSVFSHVFLPDTSYQTTTFNNSFSSVMKHALNATYDVTLDSMNSLKWTAKVNNNTGKTASHYNSNAFDNSNDPVYQNSRTTTNDNNNNSVNSSLLWRHKFKKKSRTLSVNTTVNWSESKNDGFLYSVSNFYKGGSIVSRDTTDQQNIRNNAGKSINSKIAYTEPVTKDLYLELSYGVAYNHNSNDRITRERGSNGKYESLIDSLTNEFVYNRLVNTPGLNFKLNKKKYNVSFGSSVGFNHFVQNNITRNKSFPYSFVNYYPQANFTYKFKASTSLRLNYNGSATAPTLEQLQPISDNTDPLNIYIGNPNLKQSFQHSFSVGYNSYNVLKERSIWSNVRFSTTQNAFSQYSSIDVNDSAGKRVYQTVNVTGVYNFNGNFNYNFKIKDTKWNFGFGPNVSMSRNIDFVNGIKNINKNSGLGFSVNVNQYVEKKYNFYIGPDISYRKSSSSVNKAANVNYWQLSGWANGNFTLPKKFELNSDMNYEWRQKDPRFNQNNNYLRWDASLIKRFAKGNKFELKLSVNDILDQNRGYQRNFDSYSFTETYYNTLRRFWLVTFTWNISKNGQPVKDF